jgi:hypothetical protein
MKPLVRELRNRLENAIVAARKAAEKGAVAAVDRLAVAQPEPFGQMTPAEKALRNRLRARARALGDPLEGKRQTTTRLTREVAYEHWHRMLFARFLAENALLIHPDGVPVTLAECEELAREEGAPNGWALAERYAARMLPQIFRPDDPVLQVPLAPEDEQALERLLDGLPSEIFTADDSLGWCYQFWQSEEKRRVNESGEKITGETLPAVTQLFTEHYMVQFLLDNTLGAWWAGKQLRNAECGLRIETEEDARRAVSLPGVQWEYLRFIREGDASADPQPGAPLRDSGPLTPNTKHQTPRFPWRPAAGTFPGWPKAAKEITVLDPCCGSGHFLVAALHILVPMRMREEGLSARDACDAALRDNLYGLEIDPRCTQIAAFALAFAAWRYPDACGFRPLPALQIACSGIGPQATEEQWLKLADQSGIRMPALGREPIRNGLLNLHQLFSQAPTLGSLINPAELPADLIAADYETLQPYLAAILKAEKADDETRERAIAAAGMVKAADLLAAEYTLVITNVPYLGREKQNDLLREHSADRYPEAKADLACVMLERCLELASAKGHVGLVSPQYWLFLPRYKRFRVKILKSTTCCAIAKLGPGAFETIAGEVVNASLAILSPRLSPECAFRVVDAVGAKGTVAKAAQLQDGVLECLKQKGQLSNPDAVIAYTQGQRDDELLSDYAYCYQGLATSDNSQFLIGFWEVPEVANGWVHFQMSPGRTTPVDGYTWLLHWEDGSGRYQRHAQALKSAGRLGGWKSGHEAWGSTGIAINRMGDLPVCLYSGAMFDCNVAVLIPSKVSDVAWLWSYLSSPDYASEVRRLNQKTCVTNLSFVKVPANKAHWHKVAAEKYPNGLPEPESDDPTQWLFHGYPGGKVEAASSRLSETRQDAASTPVETASSRLNQDTRQDAASTLQVAVARLLGYRWPAEQGEQGGSGFQPLDQDQRQDAAATLRLSKRARELVKRCGGLRKFADDDGVVCLPSVGGERPAADRLRELLAAAFGAEWSPGKESELLAGAGYEGKPLEEWLRDAFFDQHCKLFHQRPFIWHVWDGRKDGFSALVNYHRLDRRLLERLAFSYVNDWIRRQEGEVRSEVSGAVVRLSAAQGLQRKLALILEGEAPYDTFVRWKPLSQQPIGWEPDLNDGVRLNIRPFMQADILRKRPNIKWDKDRGKEPERPKDQYPWFWGRDEETVDFPGGKTFDGNRWNDLHYTNKVKHAAREARKDKP